MRSILSFTFQLLLPFSIYAQLSCVEETQQYPPPPGPPETNMACDFTSLWENEGEAGMQSLPIITIKVNVHWVQNKCDDLTKSCGMMGISEGVQYAQDMINSSNWHFQNLAPADPAGPGITGDTRFRYELFTDPNNPDDLHDGVWFWPCGGPTPSPQYSNVLNIWMRDQYPCQTTTRGYADPNFGKNATLLNAQNAFKLGATDAWAFGGFMNHEVGHTLGLAHSFSCQNDCKDVDLDVYEECNTGGACDPTWGGDNGSCPGKWNHTNNIMNYTARHLSLTPCQWSLAYSGALNSEADHIDVDCDHNPQDITINAGPPVIWDYTRMVNGTVTVKPGARLIITCDLYIKNHIIVERGAYLEVNGATIRNLCPGVEWKGIHVWGNAGVAHSSVDINNLSANDPGVVNLINATIHYAGNPAIYTIRGGGWNPDYWGGIVLADNTTFSDCRKAVAFMKYDHDNISRFKQCTFTSDRGFGGVTMWATKGITFENCDFLDLGGADDFGILSGDASANVIDENEFVDLMYGIYADATMPLPVDYKVGGQGQRNFFHELDYGIFSNGILGLAVDKNDFFNVKYGANIEGESEFSFTYNSFDDFTNRGIKLYVTGGLDNDIWFNSFNSPGPVRGVDAFFTNSNLEFRSNCFETNLDIWHYAVASYVRHQGSSGDLPLNFFTNTAIPQYYIVGSTNIPQYWTLDPIVYPTVNPRVIPNCDVISQCQTTSDHMNQFSFVLGDPSNFCGPLLLGGGGDQDSEEYLSLTEENDISWAGFYDQQTKLEGLEFLVDLGINPDLLETIETEQDDQVIMADISNATPFLSDNLLEAILESQALSDSQKIIALKPHVPLMADILSLAQNRLSPQYYLQLESYNSLKMFSSRDSLLAFRDEAYGDLQIIFYELLNSFWSNGDFQNVDVLLNEHDIPLSDKLKISSALVQENYSLAQTLIDNFPEQTVEDAQFKAIQEVNLKRLQNDGFYTPSTAELQFLNDYASSNTSAAVYARALLRHFNGTLFVHRDYNEPQALNGGVGSPNNQENVPITRTLAEGDIHFKIVPNPSTGDFEVQSLNGKMIRRLDLIDINGSVIFSITGEQKVMEIRLTNKPVNGIYYVVSEFTDGSRSFRSIVLNN